MVGYVLAWEFGFPLLPSCWPFLYFFSIVYVSISSFVSVIYGYVTVIKD